MAKQTTKNQGNDQPSLITPNAANEQVNQALKEISKEMGEDVYIDLQTPPQEPTSQESLPQKTSQPLQKEVKKKTTGQEISDEIAQSLPPLKALEEDPLMDKLLEYLRTTWLPHAVAMHIGAVQTQNPAACPPTPLWLIPRNMDIPIIVHAYLQDREFLAEIWPSLKIVMGSNFPNIAWTASVATSFALFKAMTGLPQILEFYEKEKQKTG